MLYSLLLFLLMFLTFPVTAASDRNKAPVTVEDEKSEPETDIVTLPDLYFECHIAEMNRNTSINLFYNETVRYYINLYFTERTDQIPDIAQRRDKYFPLFSMYLQEFNLPDELKFLPILESALSQTAFSRSGAAGLWQFKEETGTYCGLRIDQWDDERIDAEASTIAACKYLTEMYEQFGDWHLALMAYQAGPGTIRRAITSAGGKKTYEELIPYLPEQTVNYLPAYISVMYVFTYYKNHL